MRAALGVLSDVNEIRPITRPLNHVEKLHITTRPYLLDPIIKLNGADAIIGGSYALNIFTCENSGPAFVASDIDIICSAYHANGNITDTQSFSLFPEAKVIKASYLDSEIFIRHRHDKYIRNENGEIITEAQTHSESEPEEFDKYIIGSINCKAPDDGMNIQYVFVNKPPMELHDWYMYTSDLPVFIKAVGQEFVFKNEQVGDHALSGVLYGIKHEDRIKKYKDRGFNVL